MRICSLTQRTLFLLIWLSLAAVFLSNNASAQELTPRAYWPLPNGTNVFILTYQKSTGDIVTDPSLPITGVDSDIDYLQLAYQRTFSLFGRTASIQLSQPFADGATEGIVESRGVRREITGLTDARARLSVNLKGAPSMDAAGFQGTKSESADHCRSKLARSGANG